MIPDYLFRDGNSAADVMALVEAGDTAGLAALGRLRTRRSAMPQVRALLAAGWAFEVPSDDSEPMAWYWRRPPRRPGRPGRLYRSTGQAYNALAREQGTDG